MGFKEVLDLFSDWREKDKDMPLKMRFVSAIMTKEADGIDWKNFEDSELICFSKFEVKKLKNLGLEDVIHTLNKVCVYQQREINRLKEVMRYMSDIDNYNQHGRLDLDEVNNLLDKEL